MCDYIGHERHQECVNFGTRLISASGSMASWDLESKVESRVQGLGLWSRIQGFEFGVLV